MTRPLSTSRSRRPALCPQAEALEGRQLLSAGGLDTSFGTGGYVLMNSPAGSKSTPSDLAYSVAIQPDGKVLAAGQGRTTSGLTSFEVVRLADNGALDTSFGSGGRALPLTGGSSYDMALQADGRIVLAGFVEVTTGKGNSAVTQWDVALVRLTGSGMLDNTFGQGGKVITGISVVGTRHDVAYAVALYPDDGSANARKIVVGGATISTTGGADWDGFLVRYNANGSLDDGSANDSTPGDSFGTGGKVVTSWSATGTDNVTGLAIQGDGRIVAVGAFEHEAGKYSKYLTRYNADGTLDTSFGTGGQVVRQVGNWVGNGSHPIALQSDGAIVWTDRAFNGTDDDLMLARFTTTGAPDASFGGGTGLVTMPRLGNERGNSVAVQSDGKIVVVGTADSDPLMARFLPDGTLDAGFGADGLMIRSFSTGTNDRFTDVAVRPGDGKIVAVGSANPLGKAYSAFLVARFDGGAVATGFSAPTAMATPTMSVATDADVTLLAAEWLQPAKKKRARMVVAQ